MNWQKNDNIYRPLQMAHRLVSDPNQPLDEALNQIREKLTVIKNNGCGGIVTNVCFTDYLESEHFFKILQHTMQICKEMGLRVWLYDEHGYPSGGAGGIIVRDNPEYEAYGIVCLKYSVHKTAHFVAHLPYGHEQVISAYAVEGNTLDESTLDSRIDLMAQRASHDHNVRRFRAFCDLYHRGRRKIHRILGNGSHSSRI